VWPDLGEDEVNWLLLSTLTSIIAFVAMNVTIFWRVWKRKPGLLKSTSYEGMVSDTTLNWNLILTIFTQCTALAAGLFVIMNVLLFLLFGRWYIDARSIGIMVIAFAILLFRSFDSFWTRLFNS
jgi:hypothetical protein